MYKKIIVAGLGVLVLALFVFRFNQFTRDEASVQGVLPVRVDVITVQPEPLSVWVFAEGTAEALRKAFLNFEQPGKVVYLGEADDNGQVREGMRVSGPSENMPKGQLLARIDDRESSAAVRALEASLQSARERRKEAEAGKARAENDLKQAGQDFQRIAKIYDKGVVSRDEYERYNTNLKNARVSVDAADSVLKAATSRVRSAAAELNGSAVNLEKTSLFAPFGGVITAMNILEGNYYYPPAAAGSSREREASSAIVMIDDSSYEIRLEVSEADVSGIREGQAVYMASDDRMLYAAEKQGFKGTGFVKGRVWSVSPSQSLQRRSFLVKIRTEGDASSLRDGMFIRAWIATLEKQEALTLPWQVLSFRDNKPFVYVVRNDNTVEKRELAIGVQGLDKLEIVMGINAGERVVVRGQHLLAPGSKVQVLGER
ncbi:MAG: efflux RND transporter periplasmic adaptor subunit [Endozoicomonas sp.]